IQDLSNLPHRSLVYRTETGLQACASVEPSEAPYRAHGRASRFPTTERSPPGTAPPGKGDKRISKASFPSPPDGSTAVARAFEAKSSGLPVVSGRGPLSVPEQVTPDLVNDGRDHSVSTSRNDAIPVPWDSSGFCPSIQDMTNIPRGYRG